VAAFGVARGITNIPAGVISERIGRRWVLVLGGAMVAGGSVLGALSPNIPVLIFSRLLTGVGAGCSITAGIIAITDLSTVENRGRSLGVLQGWQLLAGLAAPGLGGF